MIMSRNETCWHRFFSLNVHVMTLICFEVVCATGSLPKIIVVIKNQQATLIFKIRMIPIDCKIDKFFLGSL